jgi:hypothetical protein
MSASAAGAGAGAGAAGVPGRDAAGDSSAGGLVASAPSTVFFCCRFFASYAWTH